MTTQTVTKTTKCPGCNQEMSSASFPGHVLGCRPYQEYRDLILNDEETPKLIRQLGRMGASKKLGLHHNFLQNWFTLDGVLRKQDGKPVHRRASLSSSQPAVPIKPGMVVELTNEQVVRAIRYVLEQHAVLAAKAERVEVLERQLKAQSGQLVNLNEVIKRMSAKQLEPMRLRIESEAIMQSKE